MSAKLVLGGFLGVVLLLNATVLGTLYMAGVIWQPTAEELEQERLAQEAIKKEAEDAARYAHLEPLPEFKSKVGYVASMSEAISICVEALHQRVPGSKSWAVNHIENRFLPAAELYKIFLDYETIAQRGEEIKSKKVTCEVEEPTKVISNWKAM